MVNFKFTSTALVLALATCQTSPGKACPPLIQYSKAQQKQMAQEMPIVRAQAPMVARGMDDYGRTRNAIRKCHELRS